MKVVGMTSGSEAYVVEKEEPIRINEYFKILDPVQGELLCESIETHAYNRFMPMDPDSDMADKRVMESMKIIGYDIDSEKIYIAKVRLLEEAPFPIETGSEVVSPEFHEIKDVLIKQNPDKGLVIGAIKNTDGLYVGADQKYKQLFEVYEYGKNNAQYELPAIFDLWGMKDYPHIGVFGGSGSGKSYGLRVIMEELMRLMIPTVVSDPHNEMTFETENGEFDNKYGVFKVGVTTGIEFETLNEYDLSYLLGTTSGMTEPMKAFVENIKERGESLESFINKLQALRELAEIGNSSDIQKYVNNNEGSGEAGRISVLYDNYKRYVPNLNLQVIKGVWWRFNQLKNTKIFDAKNNELIDYLKEGKTVVIRGEGKVLPVYMSYLCRNLYYKRRGYLDGPKEDMAHYFPPFVTVIDEAHNFAPKGFDSPSKSIIREIAQEGRKYGVFLVLATQRPSILDDTTTAQLNTKFLFRTTRETDIKTIRDETDISSEESKRLPYLKSGNVFFSSAIMGRTMFIRIRKARSKQPKGDNPFDELELVRKNKDDNFFNEIKDYLPINPTDLTMVIQGLEKHGMNMSVEELNIKLNSLVDRGLLKREKSVFGDRICQN